MKSVTFNNNPPKVHILHVWNYAYQSARCSHWEIIARDRVRFARRIATIAEVLDPILKKKLVI